MPTKKTQLITDDFSARYPIISDWVMGGGIIEIGQGDWASSFVRALDPGGMAFEGEAEYQSMDAAFQALEEGLTAFLREVGNLP
jgi:hypothetical protein